MKISPLLSKFGLLSLLMYTPVFAVNIDFTVDVDSFVSMENRTYIKTIKEKIVSPMPLESYKVASEVCGEIVRPLYKHQREKEYHVEYSIAFERTLPGPSEYCQVSQPVTAKCSRRRIAAGVDLKECLWQHQRCLSNKRLQVKLLSDLYQDDCDNILRGFTWINYSTPGEDMMDSVSPGHTLRLVQMFSSGGQYEAGETYPVHISSFVFFARP